MDGAPGAPAVALKDTVPGVSGCRPGARVHCQKFSPMLSICRRAVRRG
jgi:hypothetical protein